MCLTFFFFANHLCARTCVSVRCLVFCRHIPAPSTQNADIITGQSCRREELFAEWVIWEHGSDYVPKKNA